MNRTDCFKLDDVIHVLPSDVLPCLTRQLSNERQAKDLAGLLNLPNETSVVINWNGDDPAEEVIRRWSQMYPDACTIRVLIAKLEELGRQDLAENLRKRLKNQFSLCVVLDLRTPVPTIEDFPCHVEGRWTLKEAVDSPLQRLGLCVEDFTIARPQCPIRFMDTSMKVDWDTPAHYLRGLQVTLAQNSDMDSTITSLGLPTCQTSEDNDDYSYILNLDLREDEFPTNTGDDQETMPKRSIPQMAVGERVQARQANVYENCKMPQTFHGYKHSKEKKAQDHFRPLSDPGKDRPESGRYVSDPTSPLAEAKPWDFPVPDPLSRVKSEPRDLKYYDDSDHSDQYLSTHASLPFWQHLGQTKNDIKQVFRKHKKQDGCYIIRHVNEQECKMALTVTSDRKLKHFLIHKSAHREKYYLFNEGYHAGSVGSLVDYYRTNPLCPPATLDGPYHDTRHLLLKIPIHPGPNLETVRE